MLLIFQLAGEVLVRVLAMPVAGPVAGMALLFVALAVRRASPQPLQAASGMLLRHFPLLFVPAGVGVLVHAEQLAAEWLPIFVTLAISLVLTFVATALSAVAFSAWRARR